MCASSCDSSSCTAAEVPLKKPNNRWCGHRNHHQIYGTQFQLNPDFTYSLYPIDDIEGVNARREEVGLEPLDMEENITISR